MSLPRNRLLFPNLQNLFSEDPETGDFPQFLWDLYKESFFHLFDGFNTTILRMKETIGEITESEGDIVLRALSNDLGDSYAHGFPPTAILPNTTTTGTILSAHACHLISFPVYKAELVKVNILEFLKSSIDWRIALFCIIMSLIIQLFSSLDHAEHVKRSNQIQKGLIGAMRKRKLHIPRWPVRLVTISGTISLFMVGVVTIALINTNQVSVFRYKKIDHLADIYRQKLTLGLEYFSGCTSLIEDESYEVIDYLEKNRFPQDKKLYNAIESVFGENYTQYSLENLVFLLHKDRWEMIKRKTCYEKPNILIEHPPYVSRTALRIELNPLVVNKRFPSQELMNRHASPLIENDLFGRSGVLAMWAGQDLQADLKCMNSKPLERSEKNSLLRFTFIEPIFVLYLLVVAISLFIFLIEITL